MGCEQTLASPWRRRSLASAGRDARESSGATLSSTAIETTASARKQSSLPSIRPGSWACGRTRRRRFALHGGDRDTWTVSSANLDLVRSVYAAWERGDFSSVEWAHPDIELVFADGPDPSNWTGLAGMSDGFGDFL